VHQSLREPVHVSAIFSPRTTPILLST